MLLSLDWLNDYVKLPKNTSAEDLSARLTQHTVEVEGIENQADKYANVVVGKILTVDKHPNADRLRVTRVNIGQVELEIVCGAPNIEPGQLVPVALVGAKLPNGLEIKEAEVRGVKSCGMLCAPDELGLGDDHAGILILDAKAKIGEPLAKHLNLNQVVFEVDNKSLSNRPDLWGHYGIAREIASFMDAKFVAYKQNRKLLVPTEKKSKLDVKVEAADLCPRYMAINIEGVKIEPSPEWLTKRLIAVGMRPINNIVDVTNYVMLEFGQPLHAFDAAKLDKIVVRRAHDGEVIETLDGEKRKLDKEMLVIADNQKAIAIAGVMGGGNSEISDSTVSITIEAATFNYISIRKTSTKLGLRTESSMRFEKGLDVNLAETGLIRAVELIKKLCPEAKVVCELVDVYSNPVKPIVFDLNMDWLESRLGMTISAEKVVKILCDLGFDVKAKGENLSVTVPSWRSTRDVEIAEDIVEEVARIYGYNNIKAKLPGITLVAPEKNEERAMERKIKELLAYGCALNESQNYSFVGEEQLNKLQIDFSTHLRLANPLASHHTMLRQSLVPNLLENVKVNQPRYKEIGIFEIGSVFLSSEGELVKDNLGGGNLPYQEKRLAVMLADDNKEDLFRKLKGILEYVLGSYNQLIEWRGSEILPAWADESESAEILVAGKSLGLIAKVSPKITKGVGIKKTVVIAEMNLRLLLNLVQRTQARAYQEFDKFPAATRDLAFVVNQKISYSDIRQAISGFNELIKAVELFDVYQGGKLEAKEKSLAFHIVYQADRTMTSEEVDGLQKNLIKHLEERFEAKVRDY